MGGNFFCLPKEDAPPVGGGEDLQLAAEGQEEGQQPLVLRKIAAYQQMAVRLPGDPPGVKIFPHPPGGGGREPQPEFHVPVSGERGRFQPLWFDDSFCVYQRVLGEEAVVVAVNRSGTYREIPWQRAIPGDAEVLLTVGGTEGTHGLHPRSAIMVKVEW